MRRILPILRRSLVFVLALLALETNAIASPTFPDVVKETLALPNAPPCTTCHTTSAGGTGTANQPFALYLKSRGLRSGDVGSLRTALQALIGEKHDSNGDGTSDVDALRAGSDPNGNYDPSVPPVAYGCGARIAARSAAAPTFSDLLVLVGAVVLALRSRKRSK